MQFLCQRPYHAERTGSRPITEVKQRRARLVLGWETAWEHRVLLAFFLFFLFSTPSRSLSLVSSRCFIRILLKMDAMNAEEHEGIGRQDDEGEGLGAGARQSLEGLQNGEMFPGGGGRWRTHTGCWQRPHHAENAGVRFRSARLSSVGRGQYLDGRQTEIAFMQVDFSFSFRFSFEELEGLEVETGRESDANVTRVRLGKGRREREGEARESRRIYPTDTRCFRDSRKRTRFVFWLENIFSEL